MNPGFWLMVIVAFTVFTYSQLLQLSFIGARSYGPKALIGSRTFGLRNIC